MKSKLFLIIVFMLIGVLGCWTDPFVEDADAKWVEVPDEKDTPEPEKKLSQCRHYTEIVGDFDDVCTKCHVGSRMAVKETYPDEHFRPPVDTKVKIVNGEMQLRTKLTGIDSNQIEYLLEYANLHDVKKVTVEIHSPGGSLFEAFRIVGLFRSWESTGKVIETRAYGFAASAGFLILSSGTIGHRFVSPTAEMMWHELLSFAMFKLSTPSSTEEEARILRHLQDTSNWWLSERCNMTKQEIDEAIRKKEFWINGVETVEKGFADALI